MEEVTFKLKTPFNERTDRLRFHFVHFQMSKCECNRLYIMIINIYLPHTGLGLCLFFPSSSGPVLEIWQFDSSSQYFRWSWDRSLLDRDLEGCSLNLFEPLFQFGVAAPQPPITTGTALEPLFPCVFQLLLQSLVLLNHAYSF